MAIITDCLIILVETITFHKVEFFIVIVITINVIKSLTKDLFKIKVLIIFIKTNIIKSFIISKNLFSIKLLFIIIKKNIIKSSTISRNLFWMWWRILMKHYVMKFSIIAIIINIINFMTIFMRFFETFIRFVITTIIISTNTTIAIINILKPLFKDVTKCLTYLWSIFFISQW